MAEVQTILFSHCCCDVLARNFADYFVYAYYFGAILHTPLISKQDNPIFP